MTLEEAVELLREARQYVGFCPFDPDLMNSVNNIRARIDAALEEPLDSATPVVSLKIPVHDTKTCCCVDCCVVRQKDDAKFFAITTERGQK